MAWGNQLGQVGGKQVKGRPVWAVDGPGHGLGFGSSRAELTPALVSIPVFAVVPAPARRAPVTLKSLHLEQLTSGQRAWLRSWVA